MAMKSRHANALRREFLRIAVVTTAFSLAALAGWCVRAEEPDYFPLAVGNRWDYRATYRLATGNQLTAEASLVIEGVETIRGQEYFVAVGKVSGVLRDPTTTKYYRRGPQGILEVAKQENGPEMVLLPAPLRNGAQWETEMPDELFFGKVTSRQTATLGWKVPCEGRTFTQCVKISSNVETRLGQVQHDQWLAPDVGIVRQRQVCKLWTMDSALTKFVKGP
jgi:hypothetical protein